MNLLILTLFALRAAAQYFPFVEYSGTTFFDGFDFYGSFDNTTWGNVTYVDAATATASSLAYINPAGNAIIRVDNTTAVPVVPSPGPVVEYRNSVRLTSKATFDVGSLIVVDALHMPFGCSVWPSIWMNGILEDGQVWPDAGEIDIVEGINLMDHNQMALHSTAGCVQSPGVVQGGQSIITNCNDTSKSGCTVAETKPNSFGAGFASNNGGAFALQMDVAGVFMWFWPRANIPASITQSASDPNATMNLSDWGTPSSAYPAAGCNITEFFPPQQLVIDITLCGLWAGIPSIYAAGCPGTCFASNIAGSGANYAEAYFEIPYIRTWSVTPNLSGSTSATAGIAQTTGPASGSPAAATPSAGANQAGGGGAGAETQTGAAGRAGVGMGVVYVLVLVVALLGLGV